MSKTKAPTFSLHQALDTQPLKVAPQTSLDDVIHLMSQASVHCHIPLRDSDGSEPPATTTQHTSCVLVMENHQLIGILTEKDIVRLIATDTTLAGRTAADVMTHPVRTLPAEEGLDIYSALNMMRRHSIHHLPVTGAHGELVGLLTPKRLRSLMEPADFMRFRLVQEVMKTEVIYAPPTASVLHMVRQLLTHKVSCVVIVNAAEKQAAKGQAIEGQTIAGQAASLAPLGIVTERDVVQIQRLGLNLEKTQAQAIMSAPLFLVSPQDSLWEVDKIMRSHKVRRLVVADAQGQLAGIVTQEDLLPVNAIELYQVLELLQDQVSQLESKNAELLKQRNQALEGAIAQQVSRLQRREEMLRSLALSVGTQTGEDFWQSLVAYLTKALQMDYAFVGKLEDGKLEDGKLENGKLENGKLEDGKLGDGNHIRTLAVYGDGQALPNFSYNLAGTPCENVIAQQACISHRAVQQQYPEDQMLQDLQIESYLGTPLRNTTGQVEGLLVVLSHEAKAETDFLEEVLSIFAARASTELERQEMEKALRIKVKQQMAIAELGQIALSLDDLDELMAAAAAAVAQTLEIEYCKVLELLSGGTSLRLKAGVGWQPGLVGNAVTGTGQDSQAGYTLRSRRPVVVANLRTDSRFSGPALLRDHNVVSGMSVIIQGQQPYGILGAHTAQPRSFSDEDVAFLQSVANLLAQRIEQKNAQEIVIKSEQEYRTLSENLPGIVYRVYPDEQWRMVFLNDQCHTLTGFTREELKSGEVCSIDPLIVPEDRPQVIAAVGAGVAQQMPFQVEYRIRDKSGNIRYFWEKGQPIAAKKGQPAHIDGVIFDVSDRKLAEAAQQESQQRLNSILKTSQDIVWSATADSLEILYMSPSAEVVHGRPVTDFFNNPNLWSEVVHPEDKDIVSTFFDAIFVKGQAECEYRIVRPDGSARWLLDRTWLIKDAEGQAVRLDGIATDITDRKQAKQTIEEQAALLNVATDAIWVRSLTGEILFWNKGAESIYGWSAEEALSQNVYQLLCPTDSQESEGSLQKLAPTGSWQGELQKTTKQNQPITIMSRWTLVKDKQGNPTSILSVDTDITEAKQLEAQFLRAQRLESIGTLASGIAHDLNNILTPIYGISQLLPMQLPDADESIKQQFQLLQTSAKRGSKIINQVLSFARGEGEGDRAPLAVKHLIAEVRSFAVKTFPKSLTIAVNIPNDLRMVNADTTQLYQVLMNLCVNARDAMPNGGQLSLSAINLDLDDVFASSHIDAQAGPYLLITVSDSGAGIPADQRDRIFEPFFSTKQSVGGTGLGLSTVHGIVKNHGGFITVYSEVGQGTQFKVYLPAIESADMQLEDAVALPLGNGELLLVADDEKPICDVAKLALESHNYRVLVAEDGIDAIAQYAEHKADIQIVLIDMTMPTLDGSTIIRILHKMNPDLKIIAVSGLPGNERVAAALGDRVKAFLPKPYSAAVLLQTVHGIIEQ